MTLDDMIAVKREGEARQRAAFDAAWRSFAKCDRCGAGERFADGLQCVRRHRVGASPRPPIDDAALWSGGQWDRTVRCEGTMRAAGYSPPPREAQ